MKKASKTVKKAAPVPTVKHAPVLTGTDERMLLLIDRLKELGVIVTTQEFCDSIVMVKQGIWKIRKGKNRFRLTHVEKACELYNVNPSWLLGYDERMFRRAGRS